MKFSNFQKLSLEARFVNIRLADDSDLLVLPSITHSDDKQACFYKTDRTEGFDFLIRDSDIAAAVPHGNGLEINVLIPVDDAGEGEQVEIDGETLVVTPAELYFLKLVEIKPSAILKA